jgi:hypothetical protein
MMLNILAAATFPSAMILREGASWLRFIAGINKAKKIVRTTPPE